MSDQVTEQDDVQDDAAALASAMAGYNKTVRGEQPPAEVVTETEKADPPEEEKEEVPEEEVKDAPEPEPEPTVTDLAEELKALKAKVAASTSDPDSVRRMHGEIGEINRTLKKLQSSKKEDAPVDDELTAALHAAEEAAKEFPEVAGPLVKAIKALNQGKKSTPDQEPSDIDDRVAAMVAELRQKEAQEALAEEHPDYETVRETPEFKTWEATKTPEFQKRLRTTWNPAVVSRALTEFKESLKTKQKKQDRLAAAVVTPGASQKAKPSSLPDEAGLLVGYNKGPKRLTNR